MDIKSEITEKLDRPIVLVGMMGSGKSHAGHILSEVLGYPFHDTDHLIEQEQGAAISEIFEKQGETHFRKLEADKILSLLNHRTPCVISTGGGAIINPTVLNAIKEYTFSIWLMTDISTILKRIEHDGKRPLLAVPDRERKLEELLKIRKPLYAQADIKIDNSDMDETALQEKLLKALYEFLNLR